MLGKLRLCTIESQISTKSPAALNLRMWSHLLKTILFQATWYKRLKSHNYDFQTSDSPKVQTSPKWINNVRPLLEQLLGRLAG